MPTDTATPAATPEPRRDLEITITIHMRVPPPPVGTATPPRRAHDGRRHSCGPQGRAGRNVEGRVHGRGDPAGRRPHPRL